MMVIMMMGYLWASKTVTDGKESDLVTTGKLLKLFPYPQKTPDLMEVDKYVAY